jgi:hypothetical protein
LRGSEIGSVSIVTQTPGRLACRGRVKSEELRNDTLGLTLHS